MPAIDAGLSTWLKAESLVTSAVAGGVAWGDRAVTFAQLSALGIKADAATEAARTIAFMSGPLVKDRALVVGRRRDLLLKVVTITTRTARLGYDTAGVIAFVIGVAENDNGTTSLTVLRKLG